MRHLPIRECIYALCFVLLLTVLYILSIGPVAWLGSRGWLPGDDAFWVAFYAPLTWLGHSTPIYPWLDVYISWRYQPIVD